MSERPSAQAADFGLVWALCQRDLLRLVRARSRWLGVVAQPLLFWAVLASGMHRVFRVEGYGALSYASYAFPGIVAMVILFTAVFATMSVIEDRQSGFLQQVLVSPAGPTAFVLGKTLGVTLMGAVQCLLCALVAPLADYPLGGIDWWTFAWVTVFGLSSLAALNFAVAWVISSTSGYHALMSVLLLPAWMLSGALYPASGGWTQVAMQLNPMSYIVAGLRAAFEASQPGLSPSPGLWLPISVVLPVLLGFGLVVASATVKTRMGRSKL